ncbi:hypothetical protein HNQ79_002654 [Streptomyces candidus]|uniref:Uncharacterized protein n=1 Tax=Streptomyces candidus TaxID=67283 RepID=A0A7X0HEJ9_9ACTN|nr:hypothetical protein [Streptomyces candidus]
MTWRTQRASRPTSPRPGCAATSARAHPVSQGNLACAGHTHRRQRRFRPCLCRASRATRPLVSKGPASLPLDDELFTVRVGTPAWARSTLGWDRQRCAQRRTPRPVRPSIWTASPRRPPRPDGGSLPRRAP